MDLKLQFIALLFSFIFGIFLAFIYNFNYNLLFKTSIVNRIIINVVLVVDLVLIYFIGLKKINNGIVHPYFYLLIILGFFLFFNLTKKFRKFFKIEKKKEKLPKNVKKD